jgi:exonuclease VII large subunit
VSNLARRLESGRPDLVTWRRRVDDLGRAMHRDLLNRLGLVRVELSGREHRLRVLDPVATLRRGFSVVQRVDNAQVVTGVGQVAAGDALQITLADGAIPAVVGGTAPASPVRRKSKAAPPSPQMERLL